MYDLFNPPISKPVDYPIVSAQNNTASTEHYEKHKVRFGGQRKTVFEYLMNGQELTVKKAINELNISSLPKRIEELKKQFGVKISDVWNGSYKTWFMKMDDKIFNQNLLQNIDK